MDSHDWDGAQERDAKEAAEIAKEVERAMRQGEILRKKIGDGSAGVDGVLPEMLRRYSGRSAPWASAAPTEKPAARRPAIIDVSVRFSIDPCRSPSMSLDVPGNERSALGCRSRRLSVALRTLAGRARSRPAPVRRDVRSRPGRSARCSPG